MSKFFDYLAYIIALSLVVFPIYFVFTVLVNEHPTSEFSQFYLGLSFLQSVVFLLGVMLFSWLAFIVSCVFIAIIPFMLFRGVAGYFGIVVSTFSFFGNGFVATRGTSYEWFDNSSFIVPSFSFLGVGEMNRHTD